MSALPNPLPLIRDVQGAAVPEADAGVLQPGAIALAKRVQELENEFRKLGVSSENARAMARDKIAGELRKARIASASRMDLAREQTSRTENDRAFKIRLEEEKRLAREAEIGRARMERDSLMAQAATSLHEGPESPAIQAVADALKTDKFKDVGGSSYAAGLLQEAARRRDLHIVDALNTYEPKYAAAGQKAPTYEEMMAKLKGATLPITTVLEDDLKAKVTQSAERSSREALQASVTSDLRSQGMSEKQIATIIAQAMPETGPITPDVETGVRRTAAEEGRAAGRRATAKGVGMAAVAALLAGYGLKKVFGQDPPKQTMDPQSMIQLATMAQAARGGQGGGVDATSRGLMDMNRLATLMKTMQALGAMQTPPPATMASLV